MSRAWLVTVLVCASGSLARAQASPPIAPLACACNERFIVPEHELPVPTNANVWVFDGSTVIAEVTGKTHATVLGVRDGNAVRFTPNFEPNQRYTFAADWRATIVVGADVDHTPPDAPIARGITIEWHVVSSEVTYQAVDLTLDAALSSDTALVRITFVGRDGRRAALLTTPTRLHLCNAELRIHDIAAVSLVALDVAGNESEPVHVPIMLSNRPNAADPCDRSFDIVPPVENYFIAIVVMLGGGLAVGLLLVWLLRRNRYDAHARAEPVSLLVAERLVHGARRMHGLVCLGAIGIVAAGIVSGAYWMLIVVTMVGWNTDGYLKARRAAKLIESPAAGAELRGSRLTVVAHGSHASIVVSARAVRAAKQRGVPDAAAL